MHAFIQNPLRIMEEVLAISIERLEPLAHVSNKPKAYQIIPFRNYMKLNGNSEHNLSPGRRGYGNETLFDLPRAAPPNNTVAITMTYKTSAAGTSLALVEVAGNSTLRQEGEHHDKKT
jgi:hypothetical protein